MKKQSGLTILETLLVLAIASAIFVFAVNQVQQYRMQASVFDVKKNVNVLFESLGKYYQANCRSLTDSAVTYPEGSIPSNQQGDLAPGGVAIADYTLSNQVYDVDINSVLKANHYLMDNWPTYSPIIEQGSYAAKFIFSLTTKEMYACWNFTNTPSGVQCNTEDYYPNDPKAGPEVIQPNQVAFWLVQVSVKIANDPDGIKTQSYLGPTGASCASSVPDFCDGKEKPQYLIWQQLPTKSGSVMNSDLWMSQVQEAAFNQLYTHDVMYEKATSTYAPTGSMIDTNYLCGN